MLFSGTPAQGQWIVNASPTTAFRHGGNVPHGANGLVSNSQSTLVNAFTVTSRADGSVQAIKAQPAWLVSGMLGSVLPTNVNDADEASQQSTLLNAHYVPDAARW